MKLLICDLDGVVNAVSNVRAHLVPIYVDRAHYWSEWHKAHVNEPINPAVRSILRAYVSAGYQICYMTSRQDTCLASTRDQLNHNSFPGGGLVMRSPEDNTPPPKMKADAATLLVAYTAIEEVVVLDDCQENLKAIGAELDKHGVTHTLIHLPKFIGCN